MTQQMYCKPFRLDIDIETCKSRLAIINKEYKRYDLGGLTAEQQICWKCQGMIKETMNTEPVCIICEKTKSEVSLFHPQLNKCSRCYQKELRRR